MRLCGSDVISCEPSLAPTASIEAYLGEHGGFGGSQTSDESPKQTGQDRSNRGASFANEVDHEVADEETARFRLGRLEQPCDHGEDEIKARFAARAPPMPRPRVSLYSPTCRHSTGTGAHHSSSCETSFRITVVTTSSPVCVTSRSSVVASKSKRTAATRWNDCGGRGFGKREKMRLQMSRAAAARIELGSDRPSAIVDTKAGSASFSRADSTTGEAHADNAAKMSDIEEPKSGSA